MSHTRRFSALSFTVALIGVLTLSGCASTSADYEASAGEIRDPLEPLNRTVYGVNEVADILVMGPVSTIYREGMPQPVQYAVRNVVRNLEMPVIALNKLLQGDIHGFGRATGRFVVNSTLGLVGIADVAGEMNMPYERTTFGTTLASWGMEPTFYVVLPLIGPSNLRDGVGRGVDYFADPIRWAAVTTEQDTAFMAANGLRMIDTRASYDAAIRDTRANSIDSYAAMRSLYTQSRDAEVNEELKR